MRNFCAIILFLMLSVCILSADGINFSSLSFSLHTNGYSDSEELISDDWHLNESNIISFGIRGGHFSKNDKHVIGGGFKYKYRDSKEIIKLSQNTVTAINDYLGGDLEGTAIGLSISKPYVRVDAELYYRYLLFHSESVKGLKIWGEVCGNVYKKWTLDDNKKLTKPFTTGVSMIIHPVISYDITDKLSIETSLDVYYLYGEVYYKEQKTENNKTGYSATFSSTSLSVLTEAVLNVGVVKRFDSSDND